MEVNLTKKEKVIVHHLIMEGTLDEQVLTALRYKGNMQAALMEAVKAKINKGESQCENPE